MLITAQRHANLRHANKQVRILLDRAETECGYNRQQTLHEALLIYGMWLAEGV